MNKRPKEDQEDEMSPAKRANQEAVETTGVKLEPGTDGDYAAVRVKCEPGTQEESTTSRVKARPLSVLTAEDPIKEAILSGGLPHRTTGQSSLTEVTASNVPARVDEGDVEELPCNYCQLSFSTLAPLLEHVRLNHGPCPHVTKNRVAARWKCVFCVDDDKTWHMPGEYNNHIVKEHCTSPFRCESCVQVFAGKFNFLQFDAVKCRVRCNSNVCPQVHNNQNFLRAHVIERHADEGFFCCFCGVQMDEETVRRMAPATPLPARTIPCSECPKLLKTELSLSDHMRKKHKKSVIVEQQTHLEELKLDEETETRRKAPRTRWKCVFCVDVDKTWHRPGGYKIHIVKKHCTSPFRCESCVQAFAGKFDFLRFDAVKCRVRCNSNVCPQVYNNQNFLRAHVIERHANEGFFCCICGVQMDEETVRRMAPATPLPARTIPCSECPKLLKTELSLSDHMRKKHKKSVIVEQQTHLEELKLDEETETRRKAPRTRWKCVFCVDVDKTWHRPGGYNNHIVNKHCTSPFRCESCVQAFAGKFDFLRFDAVCCTVRCNCTYSCKNQNFLRAHIIERHADEGFFCCFCGVQMDEETVRRMAPATPLARTIHCSECPELFNTQRNKSRHMRKKHKKSVIMEQQTHLEELELDAETVGRKAQATPFQKTIHCSECSKVFKSVRHMLQHMQVNHKSVILEQQSRLEQLKLDEETVGRKAEDIPFLRANRCCSECPKVFKNKRNMSMHAQMKHKKCVIVNNEHT